jgi:hypothetical protein
MTAHSTKSGKAKARVLQNAIAEEIREWFCLSIEDVKPSIMGEQGIDIKLSAKARQLFPFAVECKFQEKLDLWRAIEQAAINGEKEKLIPLLAFKRSRSKRYVVLEFDEFMRIITDNRRHGDGQDN